MKRWRLSGHPRVVLAVLVALALVATLPMRLAIAWLGLGNTGISAREVQGPVWFATLRDLRFGAVELGDVHAFFSPLALLLGEARVDFAGPPPPAGEPAHGAVTRSLVGSGVADVRASLPVARLFAPLPIARVDLTDVSAWFAGGQCLRAGGRVRVVLGGAIGGVTLAPSVEGVARCDAGRLRLDLQNAAGNEHVQLSVAGDGGYRATLSLVAASDEEARHLAAAGMIATNGGYALSVEGRL